MATVNLSDSLLLIHLSYLNSYLYVCIYLYKSALASDHKVRSNGVEKPIPPVRFTPALTANRCRQRQSERVTHWAASVSLAPPP